MRFQGRRDPRFTWVLIGLAAIVLVVLIWYFFFA
jgi:uncharacterized membrane protein